MLACGLAACGASAPPASSHPDENAACREACVAAADAWASVATEAEQASQPVGEAPLEAERVLDRLEEHIAALTREPRELDGEEAFTLSSAVMDAVDSVSAQIPARLRDRADAAAEAILTDRSEEGAVRAARDAAEVLEQVLQTVRPGSVEERSARRALASLGRRARATADAYRGEDAEHGDLRADRSEGVAIPSDAPETLVRAHTRAVEASTAARRECGVERRLSVPTL